MEQTVQATGLDGRSKPTLASDPAPAKENPQVTVFPDLVYKEFLAALLISILLMVWSLAVNAPLLSEADPGRTENPAKAPWYFVGLQELLVYFDPWIAGVGMPTLIIVGLMIIPYVDTTRHAVGQYTFSTRRAVIAHFLFGFALWWILIAIGEFLRGPNWHFYWPWQEWSLTTAVTEDLWSFPWWAGLPGLILYFGAGFLIPRYRWPWLYEALGRTRYYTVMTFTMLLYSVPVKIFLRLAFDVKYVLETPWFNI